MLKTAIQMGLWPVYLQRLIRRESANGLQMLRVRRTFFVTLLTVLIGFAPMQVYGECPEPVGTFYAPVEQVFTFPFHPRQIPVLTVADLNKDDLDDILITAIENLDYENEGFRIWILINNGEGSFVDSTEALMNDPVPSDYGGARQQFVIDLNGDGQNDILVSSHGLELGSPEQWPAERNLIFLSTPDGTFSDASAQIAEFVRFSHGTTVGDLDGDQDIDIFDPAIGPLLLNDGSGGFQDVTNRLDLLITEGHESLCMCWSQFVDTTGDGLDDLLVLSEGLFNCPSKIAINDGTGHFSHVVENPIEDFTIGACNQASAAADLNHDGLEDVVVQECEDSYSPPCYLRVLMSNGDGTFSNPPDRGFPDHPAVDTQTFIWEKLNFLQDVNGDGEPDILATLVGDPLWKNISFINDGSGLFRTLPFGFAGQCPRPDFVIDVDGDGGSDLVTLCGPDGQEGGVGIRKSIVPYGPEIIGNSECNKLVGGIRDNTIEGRAGNDELLGGDGADTLRGEDGEDTLRGENGDDILDGGLGDDTLIGGKGDDTYILHMADLLGHDHVKDQQGNDKLRFVDFGLELVAATSKGENGSLEVSFTDGGGLTIEQHFLNNSHEIERLEVGECSYKLSKDSDFISGTIQELIGGCIMFEDGFEEP